MFGKPRLIRNFGLKQIALLIFTLLIILPTLGVGIVVQYKYTAILQSQFINSTLRNLDAVVNQLEEQTSMVEDIANYMIFNPDLNAYLQSDANEYSERIDTLKESLEGLLIFHLFSKPFIRSITVDGYNGRQLAMGEPVRGDESHWISKAAARRGGIVWSEGYTIASGWSSGLRVVTLFRILNLYKDITTPLGTLAIRLDEQRILALLENELYREEGYVFVLGPGGELVLQSEQAPLSGMDPHAMLARIQEERVRDLRYESGGKPYYAFHREMETTGWQVITAVPQSAVEQQLNGVRWIMTAVLLGILLLCIAAFAGFQYMIIGPILRLKNETTRIKLGDFSARVPVHTGNDRNEISDLSRKFNEMIGTIQELIDHKYKLEIREREAELKLLQSQMDPHFLYNTLDTIRWTARLENAERASHQIEMLSRFFRSSLNNGHYETTLLQELQLVQSYLYLHQVRLGNRLHYGLFMEYQLADVKIPKAIIQPLVENFLIHGFRTKAADNRITVRAFATGAEIWIEVRDNGKGIAPERLEQLRASLRNGSQQVEGFGALHNIHERLAIFCGTGYGLELDSSLGNGAWVRLKIPYANGGGEHGEQG